MSEPPEMPLEQQLEQAKRMLFLACRVMRNTDKLPPVSFAVEAIGVLEQCQRLYPREYGRQVSETW